MLWKRNYYAQYEIKVKSILKIVKLKWQPFDIVEMNISFTYQTKLNGKDNEMKWNHKATLSYKCCVNEIIFYTFVKMITT